MRTLFAVLIVLLSVSLNSQEIDGWFKAGNKPGFYTIAKSEEKHEGNDVYYIQSTENVSFGGFGTMMKYIEPDEYLGKRVKLTGYIKTESVDNHAAMWFRVDGKITGTMLGFDNMSKRPIGGTTDWNKYEIVLDVPDSSAGIG